MKYRITLIASVIFGLAMISCSGNSKNDVDAKLIKVDTVRVAGEQTQLQFPGRVKAAQDVSLSFRVAGQVKRLFVKEGSNVSKGQLIAELDPTDYQIQLNATEAEYKQIKGDAERVMELYKDGSVSTSDNDKAKYGIQQIEAKYQHAKDVLSYTKMYAPFSGQIQKRLMEEHETVNAGTPILSMVSTNSVEVEINLPASEYVRRNTFTDYTSTIDVYPGVTFRLTPISIAPKANANQLYTMRLHIEAADKTLPAPGMNTMVNIICNTEGTVTYKVPTNSLLQKDGKSYLYVYDSKSSKIHLQEVQSLSLDSEGNALITSKDITAGDIIVASGVHHVNDGDKVTVIKEVSSTNVGGLL